MKRNRTILFLILIIIIIITILMLLTNCESTGSTNLSVSNGIPDFQYSFKLLGSQPPVQKSNLGYYHLIDYQTIVFTDQSSLISTALCNKSDCLHTTAFPECNARINNWQLCSDNFQLYRENIYYLSHFYDEATREIELHLNAVSLDGTKKKKVLSITNLLISDWFLKDGLFYYQPSINADDTDVRYTAGNFYCTDLSTKETRIAIDFTQLPGVYGAVGSLRNVYKQHVYLTVSGYAEEEAYEKVKNGEGIHGEIPYVRKIMRYSLNDGSHITIDPLLNDYEFIGFSSGRLVGADRKDEITRVCLSELDGNNSIILFSTTAKPNCIFCDDNYVYVLKVDLQIIEVYTDQGSKQSTVTVPDDLIRYFSPACLTFGDEYIFFQKTTDQSVPALYMIDKTQFFIDGSELSAEEVFRNE